MGKFKQRLLAVMMGLCLVAVGVLPMSQSQALSVSAVTNLKKVSTSSSSVKMSWSKVSNVSGYEVRRATSKNGTYSLVKTLSSSSTTYTNSGLSSSKTYYYKVRAYKISKNKKYYGKYSSVLSATTKQSANQAYRKFLEQTPYLTGTTPNKLEYFFTLDINKDGVKELIFVDKTERDIAVYTYKNGYVKYCGDYYDRGIVYVDKLGRLARRFINSAENSYYYLTLNKYDNLLEVRYTYDPVDKVYYKETSIPYSSSYGENRTYISKSQYNTAVKNAGFSRYVNKHKNTSSNRSKYLK